MERIYKLRLDAISKIKRAIQSSDFESVYKTNFLDNGNKGFLLEDLDIVDGYYEIPEITLKIDKKGKFDFENSKLIYNAFRFLTPDQANDSRLWVYLSNCYFYEYTKARWLSSKSTQDVFLRRILYEGDGRGVRTRNSISRLWWTAYLTLDDTMGFDDWSLTEAIFEIQDLQVGLLERNMGSYPNVLKGFLRFYLEKKSEMNSSIIQEMAKELNNIGGVYYLPILTEEKINSLLESLFIKNK